MSARYRSRCGALWALLVRARARVVICESSDGVARSDEARPLWGCGPFAFPDRLRWQVHTARGPADVPSWGAPGPRHAPVN